MFLFKILSFLVAGMCVSWGLILFILKWSERRHEFVRASEFHHAHKAPVPRLGGIALATAFVASAEGVAVFGDYSSSDAATLLAIVSSSLAMFALGLWDDVQPLGAKFKLVAQIAIATAVYFSNIRIDFVKSPASDGDLLLGFLSFPVTVLWLVALTNLINLIDGIDGLAGGICLMLMFLLANLGAGAGSVFPSIWPSASRARCSPFSSSTIRPPRSTWATAGLLPRFPDRHPLHRKLQQRHGGRGVDRAGLRAGAADCRRQPRRSASRPARAALFRPDRKHIHHHLITLGISREGTLLNLYTVSLMCLFLAFGIFYLQGRMLPLYTGLLFLVLLIAGHLSGFTKNWFEISSQLGKSLALRNETRYALTLNRWLVLEIERHNSTDQFWRDYQFVIGNSALTGSPSTCPTARKIPGPPGNRRRRFRRRLPPRHPRNQQRHRPRVPRQQSRHVRQSLQPAGRPRR